VERKHHEDLDPAVADCFEDVVAALAAGGAVISDVEVPYYEELSHAANLTSRCEACAYHRPDLLARWDDYGTPTRVGLSSGFLFSGADYVQAQRVRALGQAAVAALFEDVHVILAPTTRAGAPAIARLERSGMLSGVFTMAWSAVGVPVISVPMGFDPDGLPLGLQIAGPAFGDAMVLCVADAYQQLTDWHTRVPDLTPWVHDSTP
jgi:aspartyl-tRNA(Asn)/glutamyl-tRNA(Gln) amidotransferase subunit A